MFQQLIQYLLLGVFLFTSADAKWVAEIPGAPPRRLSKLLKLPSWIVNIQGKKKYFYVFVQRKACLLMHIKNRLQRGCI